MRITFSVSGYPPSRGGCEHLCQQYAERLAARGHSVTVIAPDLLYSADFYTLNGRGIEDAPLDPSTSAVSVHRTNFISDAEVAIIGAVISAAKIKTLQAFLKKSFLWLVTRRYHFRLFRTLANAKPDIIIVFVHLHPNVRVSLKAARSAGAATLYVPLLHEEDPHWPMEGVKKCIADSDGVLALTQNEGGILTARYKAPANRVFIAGVGVDVSELPKGDLTKDNIPTILYLGRKTEGKGLLLLADAVQLLKSRGLHFRVALVGSSADDTSHIESRFCEILGSLFTSKTDVSESEKWDQLSKCSVLALPSDRESFGIVILEAWSCKKPVVTISTPVSSEIIADKYDGFLVAANDPTAFADSLEALIISPALALECGERGYHKVKKDFNWDRSIDVIEDAMRVVTVGSSPCLIDKGVTHTAAASAALLVRSSNFANQHKP